MRASTAKTFRSTPFIVEVGDDWTSVTFREPEQIGDVMLSIQASSHHYCSPRVDGLWLDEYETVEVAVFRDGEGVEGPYGTAPRQWLRPSQVIETDQFDGHWVPDDDVAACVPLAQALALRDALRYHFGVA